MATSTTRRTLQWLFGDEGTVATDAELQVVVVSMALATSGVFALSPVMSALSGPYGVPDARMGAIITAYTAPSVVFVPVVGILADRFGRRPLFVGGLLLFGFGGTAAGLTTDFEVVLGLRAVQGVGFAAINPLGVTIIGDRYRGKREATAQGLRAMGIQFALLVVPPLAGALVLVAWQLPYLLYGLAFPVAAWAWVAIPASTAAGDHSTVQGYLSELISLLREPTLAALQLSFIVRFGLSYGFFAFISVLLARNLGGSTVQTGFVVAGIGVIGLAATAQIGRFVAVLDDLPVLVAALVAVGAGIAVVGASPSYLSVGLGALILGVGLGVSAPIQKSLVTRFAPDSLRAGAVSSALLFQSIGQAVGPLALGLLVAWSGVAAAFVAFGVVGAVVGGILIVAAYRVSPDSAPV